MKTALAAIAIAACVQANLI
jgi:hypothetical protein